MPTRHLKRVHFTRGCGDRTRDLSFKLKGGGFRLAVRKKFFKVKVVRYSNMLSREVLYISSLEVLKVRLDGGFEQCHLLMLVPTAGLLDYMISGLGRKDFHSMIFFFFLFI